MFTPSLGFALLFVENPMKSAQFYEKILEMRPIEESPTFVMFALKNGVMLGLWSKYTAEPRVEMAQKPTEMDFGRTFVALDPDGHRIRIYKLRT